MGRRAHNWHFDSGKRGKEHDGSMSRKIATCGEDSIFTNFTTDPTKVTCSKCAAELAQKTIDAHNAQPGAKPLVLERIVDPKSTYFKGSYGGHRYAYKALYGGEHVGYVVIEGGYANTHWLIRTIGLDEKGKAERLGSEVTDADIKEIKGEKTGRWDHDGHKFVCKEQALLSVPDLVKSGRLRTKAQTLKDREEYLARLSIQQAREKAEEDAAAAERTAALEGLEEIKFINSLSDKARAGLEYAIRQLTAS